MNTQEIINLEHTYVLQVYPRPDFVLDHGRGCRVYDTEGREYLDCVAGIAVNALGYGDPDLLQALTEQAGKLWHVSNLYHTAPHARLAKLLCETSFADRVHYANCGASANESAFKFARRYARDRHGPDKHVIVAFTGGFHGRLFGSLAATDRPKYQEPFQPLMPGVRFARFNDVSSAEEAMADDVCAVIVEPVQGEGGVHPAAPEFLAALRRLCDRHDALLIFDEVQCGLGRTGHLWAYQGYGVVPDMLTTAKPLAGGLPMGAVLMTQRVADAVHPFDHASTFAGGPLVAAVAEKLVARVSDPAFLEAVRAKGDYLRGRLAALGSPHIREVRGCGLLIGVELDIPAADVVKAAYAHGLLTVGAGPNVLRLVPPLIITYEEIDLVVERLSALLR
ncbi:MAG: aspartate aminotransferase family protein [Caldilineales bacterium]|nr:aspartate aminotransferase family protein [Caldilineales bacterium]MDW8317940.1 aspartate aminotransferase family protein [Anaerolineae bacterium]